MRKIFACGATNYRLATLAGELGYPWSARNRPLGVEPPRWSKNRRGGALSHPLPHTTSRHVVCGENVLLIMCRGSSRGIFIHMLFSFPQKTQDLEFCTMQPPLSLRKRFLYARVHSPTQTPSLPRHPASYSTAGVHARVPSLSLFFNIIRAA